MKKAVIYTRVSTEEQASEGYSLNAQKSELIKYCESENFEVIKIYEDEGISGKDIFIRPKLVELLNDSSNNLFDIIVVWDTTRLSRDSSDMGYIIKKLKANKIDLISVTQGINTRTDEGIFQLQLMGSFGELERRKIIKRVKTGMMEKARQGEWNGGLVLGYDSLNRKLEINKREAEIVKKIFQMFLEGTNIKKIMLDLNDSFIKTKRGNKFTYNAIRDILANPIYKGYIRFGQYENCSEDKTKRAKEDIIFVKGKHKAIIDEETFDKVQSIFNSRKRGSRGNPGVYLFSSLLRCPKCGAKMNAQRVKRKKGFTIYYRCGAKAAYNQCQMSSVRDDKIRDNILNKINNIFVNQKVIRDVVDNLNKKIEKNSVKYFELRKDIQKELNKLQKNIKKCKEDYISEKIEAQVFNELFKETKKKIEKLEIQKEEVEIILQKDNSEKVSVEVVTKVLNNYKELFRKGDDLKKKKVLSVLIDKINLTNEKAIKNIEYRIKIPIDEDENSKKINSVINDSTVNRIISKC